MPSPNDAWGRGGSRVGSGTTTSQQQTDNLPSLDDLTSSRPASSAAKRGRNANVGSSTHPPSSGASSAAAAASQLPTHGVAGMSSAWSGSTQASQALFPDRKPPSSPQCTAAPSTVSQQPTKKDRGSAVDAFIVLDFEATCDERRRLPVQEIIEFPMVIVDPQGLCIVAEFQRYVRPVHVPTLSPFCSDLTGIVQQTVDAAQPFSAVYGEAIEWLSSADMLGDGRRVCVVTCGDWDLKTMLTHQLGTTNRDLTKANKPALARPPVFSRWINVKRAFEDVMRGGRAEGMPDMLRRLGLPLVGHHHSGIDDCRNIAAILMELLKRNPDLGPTTTLPSPTENTMPARGTQSVSTQWPLSSLHGQAAAPAATTGPSGGRTATNSKPDASSKGNDDTATALAFLLAQTPRTPPFSRHERDGFSRKLTMILRHRAADFKLKMSPSGLVKLEDITKLDFFRGKLDLHSLGSLIAECPKQRLRVVFEEGSKERKASNILIGANQGHSIEGIDADLKPIRSVAECPMAVHGTYLDAWPKILMSGGLSPMGREHVHFAKGLPGSSNVISGMRRNVEVLVYLNMDAAIRDNLPLLESANGVILSPGIGTPPLVPVRYFSKVVDAKTGEILHQGAAASS